MISNSGTSGEEKVILVDSSDNEIGLMGKMQAHAEGHLHRAFSVFVFNQRNELLLQRRASDKYHSANLWTNTCCSHPRSDESPADASNRRLKEEMGMSCQLSHAFSFTYRCEFDDGLIEHEIDHVFVGFSEDQPDPNGEEVSQTKYASVDDIRADLIASPEQYTMWFRLCFDRVVSDSLFRRSLDNATL